MNAIKGLGKTMCNFWSNFAFDKATNRQTYKTRDVVNAYLDLFKSQTTTQPKVFQAMVGFATNDLVWWRWAP